MKARWLFFLFVAITAIGDLSFASGVSCNSVHKAERSIPFWQLRIFEELGQGQTSQVIRVQYDQKDLAFVQNKSLHLILPALAPLSEKEREVFTHLPTDEITEILKKAYSRKDYDMERIGLENSNPSLSYAENERPRRLREVAISLSEMRVNYDLLKSFEKLTYQGHPIAPKTYGIVYDPGSGLPIGYLIEIVKGRNLFYWVKNKLITQGQLKLIRQQVLDQVQVLHAQGFLHGDLNPGNIMVDIRSDGELVVRLIDFNSPLTGFFKSPTVDGALFQAALQALERAFPLPE